MCFTLCGPWQPVTEGLRGRIGSFNPDRDPDNPMAGKWRQLIPHFLAMFLLYAILVIAAAMVFDVQSFWVSLGIALAIALTYPGFTRWAGIEPEVWRRE